MPSWLPRLASLAGGGATLHVKAGGQTEIPLSRSLDAERESAEAYIVSQRHARWTAVAEHYDDGGYTGANLDRPALERRGTGDGMSAISLGVLVN